MVHSRCWMRALVIFLLIWFGVLVYLLGPLWKSSENEELMSRQLVQANGELVRLGEENNELRDLLKKVQEQLENDKKSHVNKGVIDIPKADNIDSQIRKEKTELSQAVAKVVDGPTQEYELARRKIFRDANELWWYIRANLEAGLKSNSKEFTGMVNKTLIETQHRHSSLLADLNKLAEADGFKNWREREAKELSNLVQKRLHALQNPKDCSTARKLVCKLNKGKIIVFITKRTDIAGEDYLSYS